MKKSRKEKSKKRDAFKRAAVLITVAFLVMGLFLTACPTPAPDTPAPPEYTAVAYGENGQGLKEYLNGLPEDETVHGIEVTGVSEAAIKGEPGVPGEPTTTGPSPLGSIIKASGKKVALKLPADLPKVGVLALQGCTNLISVDLSACTGTEILDEGTFAGCGLTEVKLPKGLTSIGLGAFDSCSDLKTIDLSGFTKLTTIGESAFYECEKLATVYLSSCTSLAKIADFAFYGCKDLVAVDLSGCTNLTEIGSDAFYESTNAEVKLPKSITKIEAGAFGMYDEANCKKVLIPKSKYDVIKGLVTAASFPEDRIEQYED